MRLKEVKQVQLGITTRCNSHCRFCYREELLRNRYAERMDFYKNPIDLPFESFKRIFLDTKLTDIQFCGNKGDAIFHPEIHKILDYAINQDVFISLATNGSAFNEKWWKELGKRMKGEVTFALDGTTKEVHNMYRGTSFDNVMKHMIAYIEGGGRARWQFIVFKHNEHQLEEAKELSKKIGCQQFIKIISRFYDDVMEKPSIATDTKREMYMKVSQYPTIKKLMFGEVKCQWAEDLERVYVSSRGFVYTCCYMCCHAQGWNTHPEILKHFDEPYGDKHAVRLGNIRQLQYNIANSTLPDIIQMPWFTHIYDNVKQYGMCEVNCTNLDTYNNKIRVEEEL